MTSAPHLHKRPNSQNWQLRLMIPEAARASIGRREFTKSLGVSDKRQAVELSHAILAEWKAIIDAGLSVKVKERQSERHRPDAFELDEAALSIGYERATNRAEALIRQKAKISSAVHDNLPYEFDKRHRDAVRARLSDDHDYWIDRARRIASERNWDIPEESDEFRRFSNNLGICGTDTFAYAKAFSEGKADNFKLSKFVLETKAKRHNRAEQGESILDLFDRYAALRLAEERKRTYTINQDRKIVELFVEYVGSGRSLNSINSHEVREWRNGISSLPPAFRKQKIFANLGIKEAFEKSRSLKGNKVTAKTVNKYLSTISPIFAWARQEGYVDHNPCDGLFYDLQKYKKAGKNRRPPFSVEQLNTILSSPLFSGFLRTGKEWIPGDERSDDWRAWIPIVCLFTGARIGEIAQLRLQDILQEDDIPYILIKNDEQTGQQTKSGHTRPCAIHKKLIEIGWLEYVTRQRIRAAEDGNDQLFPDLKPNDRGHIGSTPSRFWREYLTKIGIKSGRDGFGAHSFRHGLTDQLRMAGFLDDEIEVTLGHNQVTVTGGYGSIRQGTVQRLRDTVNAATFPGVDFSKIRLADLAVGGID